MSIIVFLNKFFIFKNQIYDEKSNIKIKNKIFIFRNIHIFYKYRMYMVWDIISYKN